MEKNRTYRTEKNAVPNPASSPSLLLLSVYPQYQTLCLIIPFFYCTVYPHSSHNIQPYVSSIPSSTLIIPQYPGLGIRSSVFQANRSFFAQKWANERFAQKHEQFTHSLIFGERPERFAHDRPHGSFLVSNLCDSLISVIFGEKPERFTHTAHQKRGNEQFAHF